MLLLEADSVIEKAPLIKKNQAVLTKMFDIVSQGGIGMGSITKILPLINQIKK